MEVFSFLVFHILSALAVSLVYHEPHEHQFFVFGYNIVKVFTLARREEF